MFCKGPTKNCTILHKVLINSQSFFVNISLLSEMELYNTQLQMERNHCNFKKHTKFSMNIISWDDDKKTKITH